MEFFSAVFQNRSVWRLVFSKIEAKRTSGITICSFLIFFSFSRVFWKTCQNKWTKSKWSVVAISTILEVTWNGLIYVKYHSRGTKREYFFTSSTKSHHETKNLKIKNLIKMDFFHKMNQMKIVMSIVACVIISSYEQFYFIHRWRNEYIWLRLSNFSINK